MSNYTSRDQNWGDQDMSEDGIEAEIDLMLAETRKEVKDWMDCYGRSIIREWMADNCKKLLAADGVTPARKPGSNTSEKSSRTSQLKKTRGGIITEDYQIDLT